MEVHAHAHTARKKWTHYFWEFFMLFLAVTLGFFVENLRESIKNKEKVHADMHSIISDLNSDITYFDSVFKLNEFGAQMADSLIYLLHNDPGNTSEIYYLARSTTANFGYFYSNSKTFDQMKSSGILKLISPRSLLDSIANYYASFQWLANQTELQRLKVDQIHKGNTVLFDSYIFFQMMHIDFSTAISRQRKINRPQGKPAFLTHDPDKINSVSLNYHYFSTTTKFYDMAAYSQRLQAGRLVELIKQRYFFK